jgi:hypothetical protein
VRIAKKFRALTDEEREVARSVFHDAISYDNIVLTDGSGVSNRAFTLPAVFELGGTVRSLRGKYHVNVGSGFEGMCRHHEYKALLIHELMHVWQGEHGPWRWSYVVASAWHQLLGNAYAYDLAKLKEWRDYNPEQQAQIVEDWFKCGMEETDPRFRYVRDHVRTGKRA